MTTTINDIRRTVTNMAEEFNMPFRFDEGNATCGITWKLNFNEMGRDILTAQSKAAFLHDIQNYRQGLRDAQAWARAAEGSRSTGV
jgi:hypothetical protein